MVIPDLIFIQKLIQNPHCEGFEFAVGFNMLRIDQYLIVFYIENVMILLE
jgi:hypothetical protein